VGVRAIEAPSEDSDETAACFAGETPDWTAAASPGGGGGGEQEGVGGFVDDHSGDVGA